MRDLAALGRCLLETEGASLRSVRRRRMALLASISLQTLLLATLVMIPLLVGGEHLPVTFTTICPRPPYGNLPAKAAPPSDRAQRGQKPPVKPPSILFSPPEIPAVVASVDDAGAAPALPAGESGGPFIPGLPDGLIPLEPGGSRRGQVPEPPPAPEPPGGRIRISEIDPGQLVRRVEPKYPPLARQTRLEGTVRLRAIVGTDGRVREVEMLSGHALLAQAAMDAVLQWRYRPTLLNGRPVDVETQITVVFVLNR